MCDEFNCIDCDECTRCTREYYMLQRSLWLRAVPGLDGMLCVGCVELRIGRPLSARDFMSVPVNDLDDPRWRRSERLTARLKKEWGE